MTEKTQISISVPTGRSIVGAVRRRAPLVLGVLVGVAWVALMIALFMGMDVVSSGLSLSGGLLALLVLASISTIPAKNAWTVATIVATALYAATWWFFLAQYDSFIADGLLYALVAVFYLSVPAAAVFTAMSARSRKSLTAASEASSESSTEAA